MLKGTTPGSSQDAAKALSSAKGMMQSGNYSQAIPRLSHVAGTFVGTPQAVEAHFLLGQAYFELGGYGNAHYHFQKCMESDGNNAFAGWCQDYLGRLTSPEGAPYASQPEYAESRIRELLILLEEEPEELSHPLELADLYWRMEQYEAAGSLYNQVFLKWPRLQGDMVLRQRIAWEGDGLYKVITPESLQRQRSEEEPLVVFGTSSFRSGRYKGYTQSFRETEYNVSGKVVNRSEKALGGVKLHITIYGFGEKVYDVQRVDIGNLGPGITRTFNAVFTNFDDINNVSRYEIQGEYEWR